MNPEGNAPASTQDAPHTWWLAGQTQLAVWPLV